MEGTLGDYQRVFHTGQIMGGDVFAMLSPAASMRVLDLGCGDGLLTQRIADSGAEVVGVDVDPAFCAAAQERGLDVRVLDGQDLCFDEEFDRVFSNAALHWMSADPEAVVRGVEKALRPGGRFVAEFGGHGNISAVVSALAEELQQRGFDAVARNPWFFPRADEYAEMLQAVGLAVEYCELIPRPTRLDGDLSGWLRTFCGRWLYDIDSDTVSSILAAVRDGLSATLRREGVWTLEYVRLRVVAKKPLAPAELDAEVARPAKRARITEATA